MANSSFEVWIFDQFYMITKSVHSVSWQFEFQSENISAFHCPLCLSYEVGVLQEGVFKQCLPTQTSQAWLSTQGRRNLFLKALIKVIP